MNKNGGDGKSLFGEPLMRREFKSSFEKKKFIEQRPGVKLYDSFSPLREFLIEKFEGKNTSKEFNKNPLKIHYLDIEVAVGHPKFPLDHKIKVRKREN